MDILKLIKPEELKDFMDNYDYKTEWLGSTVFPAEKTDDLEFTLNQLGANATIPAIAKVHAFDTEARIGSREQITTKHFEKLLIKEKLPTSERAQYLLRYNDEDKVIKYIYSDFDIENQRVLARIELQNMTLLSTGQLSINENNFNKVVDYGYKSSHNVSFTSWSDPTHDIAADLNAFVMQAANEGKTITKAITSSKVISYLTSNKGIIDQLKIKGAFATTQNVLNYIYEQFGIQFAVNDERYKIEGGDSTTHRFFPENKISFLTSLDFGKGLYAPTPDELMDVPSAKEVDQRANIYLKAWKEQDPSTVYTMASAVYLPIVKDIDNLFIATVTA